MARRSNKRPYHDGHRELNLDALASMPRQQRGPGGNLYSVSRLSGSTKIYVCPACNQDIALGSPHVVAWRLEANYGLDIGVSSRRHWHTYCWERGYRG